MFQEIKTKARTFLPTGAFIFLLVMPASTNYKLKDYGFGSGGTAKSDSASYSMTAIAGEQSGAKTSSSGYDIGSGLIFANQANVPSAPTLTNPSDYYNKLQIIINTSDNPSDAKFAIAISTDNFVTTKYVQSDHTVGNTLGSEDYQTYASWGGAGGTTIIGLASGTTYQAKVKATAGHATETGYGQTASATTANSTLSFGISTNSINFGDLIPNAVGNSPQNVTVSFATNGENGGKIYILGNNAGLYSAAANYKINSVSGDLTSLSQGFGVQGISTSQSSGGPLSIASIYNQSGNIVGATDQIVRNIFDSSGPVIGGSGTFLLKAKPSTIAPSAADYREILTIIASGSF